MNSRRINSVCVGYTATMRLINVGALIIGTKTSLSLVTTYAACLEEVKQEPFSVILYCYLIAQDGVQHCGQCSNAQELAINETFDHP